eukprot:1932567-Pyramimonas_sp.AAC.2
MSFRPSTSRSWQPLRHAKEGSQVDLGTRVVLFSRPVIQVSGKRGIQAKGAFPHHSQDGSGHEPLGRGPDHVLLRGVPSLPSRPGEVVGGQDPGLVAYDEAATMLFPEPGMLAQNRLKPLVDGLLGNRRRTAGCRKCQQHDRDNGWRVRPPCRHLYRILLPHKQGLCVGEGLNNESEHTVHARRLLRKYFMQHAPSRTCTSHIGIGIPTHYNT